MSSTACLIKRISHRQSILEVSYSLTPLDAARVTNPKLYLFCLSHPSPVSLLVTMSLSNTYVCSSLYFWNCFFLKLRFIHGARETSSDKTQGKKKQCGVHTHFSESNSQNTVFPLQLPCLKLRFFFFLCQSLSAPLPHIYYLSEVHHGTLL